MVARSFQRISWVHFHFSIFYLFTFWLPSKAFHFSSTHSQPNTFMSLQASLYSLPPHFTTTILDQDLFFTFMQYLPYLKKFWSSYQFNAMGLFVLPPLVVFTYSNKHPYLYPKSTQPTTNLTLSYDCFMKILNDSVKLYPLNSL